MLASASTARESGRELEPQRPIELTSDPRFAGRVMRLAVTSVVALGVIFAQLAITAPGSTVLLFALGAGWILMPLILGLSLRRPALRYGVIAPAGLISLALTAICLQGLSTSQLARSGWLLLAGGVWLGAFMGAWFWLRWLPVPAMLHDPYSPGRWALIALHVGLIVAGLGLVLASDLIS